MAPQRSVRLSLKKPTYAVCVVGVETSVDVHRCELRGTHLAAEGWATGEDPKATGWSPGGQIERAGRRWF